MGTAWGSYPGQLHLPEADGTATALRSSEQAGTPSPREAPVAADGVTHSQCQHPHLPFPRSSRSAGGDSRSYVSCGTGLTHACSSHPLKHLLGGRKRWGRGSHSSLQPPEEHAAGRHSAACDMSGTHSCSQRQFLGVDTKTCRSLSVDTKTCAGWAAMGLLDQRAGGSRKDSPSQDRPLTADVGQLRWKGCLSLCP